MSATSRAGAAAARAEVNGPLRVLLVMGTSAGGVGRYVSALADALAAAGHRVSLAAPARTLERFTPARGVRLHPVPLGERVDPRHDLRVRRELVRLAGGADVVHAHGIRAGALAVLARTRRAAPPIVVTLHNAPPAGALSAAVYAVLEVLVARGADSVLVVSPDLGERMRVRGAARVALAVVPAAAAPVPSRAREQTRAALGVPARTWLLVTVGRLADQKGLTTLVDAVAGLAEVDVLAVVAGEGPLERRLTARIHRTAAPVRLLGARADVPDLLAAADVAVSAARWEGQPLWLQEALLLGRPIVATDAGGTRTVVQDAASWVPVGDPAALRRALREVLTDPASRERLGAAACRRAAELPSGQDALDAALRAHREVLAAAAASRAGTGRR